MTPTFPQVASSKIDYLDLFVSALKAQGRMPKPHPTFGPEQNPHQSMITSFDLEERLGGWVIKLDFYDMGDGTHQSAVYPDKSPVPCKNDAFLAGAGALCHVLSGSDELPFANEVDALVAAGFSTSGLSLLFSMKHRATCC